MPNYRVLVVTNLWPYEGDPSYGNFVREQMESLRPLGVDYETVFINGRESKWDYFRAMGEMRRRLRGGRFDLIHAHFGLAGLVARCQFRVPLVVTFHGDDVLGQFKRGGGITLMGRFYQLSSFILARLATGVIVQSRQMGSRLRLKSAHIIPQGIDLGLFQPLDPNDARRALQLDLEKKFVLFPYDPAVERKRFDIVEASVARALAQVPGLEILQVRGVPNERMPLYMNAADLLVLPSLAEGSPVAVKEALATNLPVITVDVGDAAELIAGVEGCFLVPRDAEAIAAKIVEVCRRDARSNGREKIGRLSLEAVAKQVVEVYGAVLARR
jgi:glycosyltransferase involved in cell wall biosynthesis